jgi:hypothetical protein
MVMGYRPSSLFGKVIASKTWMNISHVETYVGDGMSVAARWDGVNMYPVREDETLCVLLEPDAPFNLQKAMVWFYSHAQGMRYDLWGMRIFFRLLQKTNPHRMWCSEFCAEFYRAGGYDPFNPHVPSDRISPAQFLQTGRMQTAWHSPSAFKAQYATLTRKGARR